MIEQELTDICKALSVPSRLKILKLLRDRRLCVNALTRLLDISQPAVSQHLTVLRQAGLVTGVKEGYMVHYSLNKTCLAEFNRAVADFLGSEFVLLENRNVQTERRA